MNNLTSERTFRRACVDEGRGARPRFLRIAAGILAASIGLALGSCKPPTSEDDSQNADLRSLTVSSGVLSPSFSPHTTNYSLSVGSAVSVITVSAVPGGSGAKAEVRANGRNWAGIANGAPSGPLDLVVPTWWRYESRRVTAQLSRPTPSA